ncbi:unnamed protein product, partial [Ceratitis capitata]
MMIVFLMGNLLKNSHTHLHTHAQTPTLTAQSMCTPTLLHQTTVIRVLYDSYVT